LSGSLASDLLRVIAAEHVVDTVWAGVRAAVRHGDPDEHVRDEWWLRSMSGPWSHS
jgi:hypothetical protein